MSDGLEARYRSVVGRIAEAANGRDVRLLAVSKSQSWEKVEALYRLGHRDFGENYVQEAVEKAAQLAARGCVGIRWHFIGHLQTNKVRSLAPILTSVHSVDSDRLAKELAKQCSRIGIARKLPVFLEVNIDSETSKAGVSVVAAATLAKVIAGLPELELQGLMCIPALGHERRAGSFRALRELEVSLRPLTLGRLSMGMSDDFELAVREGATDVRVGSSIFGEREKKAGPAT